MSVSKAFKQGFMDAMMKMAVLSEEDTAALLKDQGLSDDEARKHYQKGLDNLRRTKRNNLIAFTLLGALAGGGLSLASNNDMLGYGTSPGSNALATALIGALGGNLSARLGNVTGEAAATSILRRRLKKLKKREEAARATM
jgi:hypothetical protein